jgi:hypothetical protein
MRQSPPVAHFPPTITPDDLQRPESGATPARPPPHEPHLPMQHLQPSRHPSPAPPSAAKVSQRAPVGGSWASIAGNDLERLRLGCAYHHERFISPPGGSFRVPMALVRGLGAGASAGLPARVAWLGAQRPGGVTLWRRLAEPAVGVREQVHDVQAADRPGDRHEPSPCPVTSRRPSVQQHVRRDHQCPLERPRNRQIPGG